MCLQAVIFITSPSDGYSASDAICKDMSLLSSRRVQWRPQPLQKTEHSACRHTSAVSSLFWSSRTALCFWGCLQTLVHILTQRSRHNECRRDFILQEANLNFSTRQQLERGLQSEGLVCPNVLPAGSCQTNAFYITNVNIFLHIYVKFKKRHTVYSRN
jgi:hypothetical protein